MEGEKLVLLCRAGGRAFALMAHTVVRVHGATAFVAVADLGAHAVGVVNVAGQNVALVSAASALGEARSALEPTQRFVDIADAGERWLLWVDEARDVIRAHEDQFDVLGTPADAPIRSLLRLSQETVPVLNVAALAPKQVFARAER